MKEDDLNVMIFFVSQERWGEQLSNTEYPSPTPGPFGLMAVPQADPGSERGEMPVEVFDCIKEWQVHVSTR